MPNENDNLLESLTHSQIFQDYERAFSEATGLPVSLRSWIPGNCPITEIPTRIPFVRDGGEKPGLRGMPSNPAKAVR